MSLLHFDQIHTMAFLWHIYVMCVIPFGNTPLFYLKPFPYTTRYTENVKSQMFVFILKFVNFSSTLFHFHVINIVSDNIM